MQDHQENLLEIHLLLHLVLQRPTPTPRSTLHGKYMRERSLVGIQMRGHGLKLFQENLKMQRSINVNTSVKQTPSVNLLIIILKNRITEIIVTRFQLNQFPMGRQLVILRVHTHMTVIQTGTYMNRPLIKLVLNQDQDFRIKFI